jgi:hypothetical protein
VSPRQRDRETERHRHTERQRERDRDRDRDRDRERERAASVCDCSELLAELLARQLLERERESARALVARDIAASVCV